METPSLEGLPTKAIEVPSPHEMRLSPAGHEPSISWSRGRIMIIIIIIIMIIIIIIIITIMIIIIIIVVLFGIITASPAGIYLLKVNNRNTRTRFEICSNLMIKISEPRHWRVSGIFIVNFEHISHFVLVVLLLTLNM